MQNPANAVETCQNNERSQFLFVEYFLVKTAHILVFVDVEKINQIFHRKETDLIF